MAGSRKRKQEPGCLEEHIVHKKTKLDAESPEPPNFPPEFYDSLSKIWFTRRAVREASRREPVIPQPDPSARITDFDRAVREGGQGLARFARAGGPDLRDLRGYDWVGMSSNNPTSYTPSTAIAGDAALNQDAAKGKKGASRRSSAYDANFETKLIDNRIYPPFYQTSDGHDVPEAANFEAIQERLERYRGSLSPSGVSNSDFRAFRVDANAASEDAVLSTVIPSLTSTHKYPNARNIPFSNLSEITKKQTVVPKPDFYDGVQQGDIHKQVREDLGKKILPSLNAKAPAAPNFFLEGKGPRGTDDVAKRQIVHNGAYGCHAMHALQNYGNDEAVYDSNAYAFSSTYCSGTIRFYAHHAAPPENPGEDISVRTDMIKGYVMDSDKSSWLAGRRAFRNLRDLAKEYRDEFVKAANEVSATGYEGEGSSYTDFDHHHDDGGSEDDLDESRPTPRSGSQTKRRRRRRPELSHSPPSPSSSQQNKRGRDTRPDV